MVIATKRKGSLERLTADKYFNLIEHAADGIAIIQDGIFKLANTALARLSGYDKEELLGMPFTKLLTPKSQKLTMARYQARLAGKKVPPIYEIQAITKDGEVRDIEINAALTEYEGRVADEVIIRDITERKQAEALFKTLSDSLLIGVYIVQDGKFVFVNPQFQKDMGFTEAELLGTTALNTVHPEDREGVRTETIKRLKGELSSPYEFRTITKSGETRVVMETITSIQYQGKRAGLGSHMDITGRKNMEHQLQEKNEELDTQNEELKAINEELRVTEEELQHSQERLERMFESVTDGIIVTSLDGTVLKVNERAVQMIGYATDDELLGKNCLECVAPADRERIGKEMLKAQEKGAIRYQECNLLKADGSEFPAELSTNILKDASGRVIGLITIARDITERKQAEELFKTLTNSSPVGIYIIQDGKFQLANPQFQKLTGYTEDELVGMDSLALVLDEDRDMVREKAIKMLKGECSFPYQFRVVNKSGETRWAMETVTSIQYRGRRAILGNDMDITERRQAEERERQLQQELDLTSRLASIGQMASGVAHEINNPLTGVIGFSHLMMSRDIPNDMKQDLQVINSEAKRVAKIVENLLTFARQRKPGRECVDINSIIARVLELRSYEMKVNNIEVETQLAPDLPCTMADAGQLQQVFLNIVLNGEHFMTTAHNKGKLLVKTERIDNNIRASFTDDGSGISEENLDKIFNPFFTTKEVGDGTGLGLSICHGIITQHKGRIYAQSELGKGATFAVELPIADDSTQAEQAEVTKEEPQKPGGAKILVVDDEPAILAFLRRLLTEWGHSVETLNNANAALDRIKTERYSLILLDIKLPGMSGVELYHHIEAIAPALTRRIMFITGDVMETATRDFLDSAKVPHITKPIDIELLKKTINHALNHTHITAAVPGEEPHG